MAWDKACLGLPPISKVVASCPYRGMGGAGRWQEGGLGGGLGGGGGGREERLDEGFLVFLDVG